MFAAFKRSKELIKKRLPNSRRSAASICVTRAAYCHVNAKKREEPNRTSEEQPPPQKATDFPLHRISGILGTAEKASPTFEEVHSKRSINFRGVKAKI
jgi:hypothetical protein